MVTGECLCGEIKYQVELIRDRVYSCHCSRCQKTHGAAFATQALADGKTLVFLKGEDKLSAYFSGGGYRAFCANCGSRLMNYAENKSEYLSVAVACIDNKDEIAPVANLCIESKLAWIQLTQDIPSYEGIPQEILDSVGEQQ